MGEPLASSDARAIGCSPVCILARPAHRQMGFVERPEMSRRSRRCPEDVQKVSRRLEKNVGTSRESSAGVQKASGVVEGLSQSGKAVGHTCLKESPPPSEQPGQSVMAHGQ